jgi:hypothetical protein
LLAGCIIEPPDSGSDYPPPGGGGGWGSGWGGGGGDTGYGCHADTECGGGYVCARNGECLAPSSVRIVRTTWTLKDQPAADATCTNAPKLAISFSTAGGTDLFGFSPVPCDAGKFTVDKLPTRFTLVSLMRAGDDTGGASGTFNVDGNATVNLPY